jgi:zinc D-Ala-D-Ala carboxypeptidase
MRYFKIEDFNCQHTGNNKMSWDFLNKLDDLRHECGIPFVITSGYRDPSHPIESRKARPGTHAQGIAADIKINSAAEAHLIMKKAFEAGFNGIGLAKNFVHVDIRDGVGKSWSY